MEVSKSIKAAVVKFSAKENPAFKKQIEVVKKEVKKLSKINPLIIKQNA